MNTTPPNIEYLTHEKSSCPSLLIPIHIKWHFLNKVRQWMPDFCLQTHTWPECNFLFIQHFMSFFTVFLHWTLQGNDSNLFLMHKGIVWIDALFPFTNSKIQMGRKPCLIQSIHTHINIDHYDSIGQSDWYSSVLYIFCILQNKWNIYFFNQQKWHSELYQITSRKQIKCFILSLLEQEKHKKKFCNWRNLIQMLLF